MKTNRISFAAAAKHNWGHLWNAKSQSHVDCKGDLQAVEEVVNEDNSTEDGARK